MKTVNFITRENLDENDFIIDDNDKKIRIAKPEIKQYVLREVNNIVFYGGDVDSRKKLTVKDNLGVIHLDFTPKFPNTIKKKLFELPPDAPSPITTLEYQFKNGGSAWIEGGQREVWGHWLEKDERVIFDLVGFFE